ncbi:hypothetical protein FB2170_01711 [Maribacter sp. HTCC2170]|nr:hypothetical protein FB2170_01711 [Maribacter sp. HTCC2170]
MIMKVMAVGVTTPLVLPLIFMTMVGTTGAMEAIITHGF